MNDLIQQYLSYEYSECSLESLEVIEEKVNDLKGKISEWANEQDVEIANNEIGIIIERFILDLEESSESCEKEETVAMKLAFEETWNAEMQDRLDLAK